VVWAVPWSFARLPYAPILSAGTRQNLTDKMTVETPKRYPSCAAQWYLLRGPLIQLQNDSTAYALDAAATACKRTLKLDNTYLEALVELMHFADSVCVLTRPKPANTPRRPKRLPRRRLTKPAPCWMIRPTALYEPMDVAISPTHRRECPRRQAARGLARPGQAP
jgi:hypothetical protein